MFSENRPERQDSSRLASSSPARVLFFVPPPCVVHFPQSIPFFFNLQASVALSNLLSLPVRPPAKAIMLKLQALKSRVNVTRSQSVSNGTFLIGMRSGPGKGIKRIRISYESLLNIFLFPLTVARMMYLNACRKKKEGCRFLFFLMTRGEKSI